MKTLIVLSVLFFTACKASKFQSGTYRVESAKKMNGKSIVRFEGVQKEFVLPTDTLKKGDLIYFTKPPENLVAAYR